MSDEGLLAHSIYNEVIQIFGTVQVTAYPLSLDNTLSSNPISNGKLAINNEIWNDLIGIGHSG